MVLRLNTKEIECNQAHACGEMQMRGGSLAHYLPSTSTRSSTYDDVSLLSDSSSSAFERGQCSTTRVSGFLMSGTIYETYFIVCNSHLPPLHHRPQLPVHPISRRLRSETLETVTIVERRRSNLARDMTSVLSACPSRTLCSCASCSVMVRIKSGALQPRTTATSTPPWKQSQLCEIGN